jgi:hypothetical protein
MNKNIDSPYTTNKLQQGDSIALQRYPGTKIIALGESYHEDEKKRISKKTWDLLKKKHTDFRFIFKDIYELTNEDIKSVNESIKHLTPKTEEELHNLYIDLFKNYNMKTKLVRESIIDESIKKLKPFSRKEIIRNLKKFKRRKRKV